MLCWSDQDVVDLDVNWCLENIQDQLSDVIGLAMTRTRKNNQTFYTTMEH